MGESPQHLRVTSPSSPVSDMSSISDSFRSARVSKLVFGLQFSVVFMSGDVLLRPVSC